MAAYALEAGPKSPRLQLNVDNLLDKKYPTDATRGISDNAALWLDHGSRGTPLEFRGELSVPF